MKKIVSITIGTIILLFALSSFTPVNGNRIETLRIETGEPTINTPDDVAQYIMELKNEKAAISQQQVL